MRNIIPFLLLVIFIESCNSLYVPATPSIPVFEKKQSLKISGSVGGKGWNANADYTPLDHLYFGVRYHGMEQPSGRNSQESLGAHLGCYFNQDFGGHSNFQFGYTLGHAYYADQFSGGEGYLRIGDNTYNQIYFQAFQALKTWKGNAWILGLRMDMYHAHYSYLWPNLYRNDVPIRSAFPMGFVCYQYSFKKAPGLMSDLYVGYQTSTIQAGRYVGYAFYTGVICRAGISYRFEFGKK